MAQALYRVVEVNWIGSNRVETDIGCAWKPEAKAKAEMREKAKSTTRQLSIQKKKARQ